MKVQLSHLDQDVRKCVSPVAVYPSLHDSLVGLDGEEMLEIQPCLLLLQLLLLLLWLLLRFLLLLPLGFGG